MRPRLPLAFNILEDNLAWDPESFFFGDPNVDSDKIDYALVDGGMFSRGGN